MQSYYYNPKNKVIILWKFIGVFSFIIPIIVLFLMLNWILEITPFQQLKGTSIILPVITSPLGIILSAISLLKINYRYAKLGLVLNAILLIVPFFTQFIGNFIFGI